MFVLVGVITRIPLLFSVPLSTMVVRSMVYYQYSSTLSILSYCELHLAGVKGLIDFSTLTRIHAHLGLLYMAHRLGVGFLNYHKTNLLFEWCHDSVLC